MKVNRSNYEIWMIDYFDGNLNASQTVELLAFLEIHPDLKEEFELFDQEPIATDETIFTGKDGLKKTPIAAFAEIGEDNYENYFIAFYENDLSNPEKKDLSTFLNKNPHLQKDFKLHASLGLEADLSILYQQKESLRKKRSVAIYRWAGAAAAVIIILFGLIGLLQNKDATPSHAFKTFVVSKLEPQKATSGIAVTELFFSLSQRPVLKTVVSEPEKYPEEIAVVKLAISTMPTNGVNISPAISDQTALFIFPANKEPDELYAFAETEPEPKKKKNAFGRVINNLARRASGKMKTTTPKEKNKKDPAFVRVLDQGILVFNTLTGTDTELLKSYDEDGNLTHYRIDGESLSWSKNISEGSRNSN